MSPYSDRTQITLSAGTAFKAGFFWFFGVFFASLIVAIFAALIALVAGAFGAALISGAN
jgi:hypothetical protein